MCFSNHDGWYASVQEEWISPVEPGIRCRDCSLRMTPGESCRWVIMKGNEECSNCGEDYWSASGTCRDGDDHCWGEEDEFAICHNCEKMRDAIKEVEVEEGCAGDEVQPPYGFWYNLDQYDGFNSYVERAATKYPELALSGYLDRKVTNKSRDLLADLSEEVGFQGAYCPSVYDENQDHYVLGGEG